MQRNPINNDLYLQLLKIAFPVNIPMNLNLNYFENYFIYSIMTSLFSHCRMKLSIDKTTGCMHVDSAVEVEFVLVSLIAL